MSSMDALRLRKKAEVLEAAWYEAVHTDAMDERLRRITLPSLKQMRLC